MNEKAALYLLPCTLGDAPLDSVIPAAVLARIRSLRIFAVEEVRTARRFLRQVDRAFDIDGATFFEIGKHADASQFSAYLEPLRKGESMGVLSEAGVPCVADPGARLVALAQAEGLRVVPLVGPSSLLMCVMASGFNGQRFSFDGYLPIDPAERQKRLKHLEARSAADDCTMLFIETPFRNRKLFDDVLRACRPQTRLCIAAALTTEQEFVRSQTLKKWKSEGFPLDEKVPAVFALYAR